jgi:hypothetical protein
VRVRSQVVEDRQIFRNRPIGRRIEVLDFGDAAPSMRVGHDHTGVNREGSASDDPAKAPITPLRTAPLASPGRPPAAWSASIEPRRTEAPTTANPSRAARFYEMLQNRRTSLGRRAASYNAPMLPFERKASRF